MPNRFVGDYQRAADRRFLRELLLLGTAAVLFACALATSNLTAVADKAFYDYLVSQFSLTADADIVIVAIDNDTLATLGHLPLPTGLHARLLSRLASSKPRAVLYDVLLAHASLEDAAFARAMSRVPVYLPVIVQSGATNPHAGETIEPPNRLASVAAGIGHINLEPDRDGVLRSVALYEGSTVGKWPQFTLPLYQQLRGASARIPTGVDDPHELHRYFEGPREERLGRVLISYVPAMHGYAHFSFVDVLRGHIDPEVFRDKIVLVGNTADGLPDHLLTPLSGDSGVASRVDIDANILDNLLHGGSAHRANVWLQSTFSFVAVLLLFTGFVFLTPRQTVVSVPVLLLATLVASDLLLEFARVWIPPLPAVSSIVLFYPIWGWRRLDAIMSAIGTELELLAEEPDFVSLAFPGSSILAGRALNRDMELMRQATQHIRDLRRFIWDSVSSLPDPVLVADPQGRIRVANRPALASLALHEEDRLVGHNLQERLGRLRFIRFIAEAADSRAARAWPHVLDPARAIDATVMAHGVEVEDAGGARYVLKYARCLDSSNEVTGWIATLSNITALHKAQAQRDEMLHLISHDMRSPNSSIVSLIEIERRAMGNGGATIIVDRIDRYARRALALADSFVRLAAAENRDYIFEVTNLADIVNSAADEVWPLAIARQVNFVSECTDDELLVNVDRGMIARALVNLLNNAIKYSPPGTAVRCVLRYRPHPHHQMEFVVSDEGYGIPQAMQLRLFERFQRFRAPGQPESDGVGLGLAFVKAVVTRHGGRIHCVSSEGTGTIMTMHLPVFGAETGMEAFRQR
ncbi:CHASE2 domain-containing protein [Paraburkholderia sp. BR14263]|uniref:CHASE2 domain-containing protein n=1 Tax=unclassified Paraburkholderia TaxID=2615204 RepID=UPI0034CDD32B